MMIQIHHSIIICDALRDLVPFVQFKKLEYTHEGVLLLVKLHAKSFTTLLKVTLLHGCFSRFLNCTNGTKSRKTSHINLACLTHSLKASLWQESWVLIFFIPQYHVSTVSRNLRHHIKCQKNSGPIKFSIDYDWGWRYKKPFSERIQAAIITAIRPP